MDLQNVSETTFRFSCITGNEQLSLIVPQVLDPSYGMYVWPCAPVLAQFVWHHRSKVKGKSILELGAGTALPGVLAAKLGAQVTLSDSSVLPQCLQNCHRTCEVNNIQAAAIIGITWGLFSPELLEMGPIDVILASDCFYDTKDFEDVLITVSYILKKNPNSELWCTYQERSANRSIEHLLEKWGLTCKQIALETFNADYPDLAGSNLPGHHTIHMLCITTTKVNSSEGDT